MSLSLIFLFWNGSVLGFALRTQARHSDWPNRVRYPIDQQFVSGCSPPRLAATQLPSTIEARSNLEWGLAPHRFSALTGARARPSRPQQKQFAITLGWSPTP
jgi:hypothetical protein